MQPMQNFHALVLHPFLRRTCAAAGLPPDGATAEALAHLLGSRLGGPAGPLGRAVQAACERGWKALEVALAGAAWWQAARSGPGVPPDQACRTQVQTFLDAFPLPELAGKTRFRQQVLGELQRARRENRLTPPPPPPDHLAAALAALSPPAGAARTTEKEMVIGLATVLKQGGQPNLAWLIEQQAARGAPLVLTAARACLRHAAEMDRDLGRTLALEPRKGKPEPRDVALTCLAVALSRSGPQLDRLLEPARPAAAAPAPAPPAPPPRPPAPEVRFPDTRVESEPGAVSDGVAVRKAPVGLADGARRDAPVQEAAPPLPAFEARPIVREPSPPRQDVAPPAGELFPPEPAPPPPVESFSLLIEAPAPLAPPAEPPAAPAPALAPPPPPRPAPQPGPHPAASAKPSRRPVASWPAVLGTAFLLGLMAVGGVYLTTRDPRPTDPPPANGGGTRDGSTNGSSGKDQRTGPPEKQYDGFVGPPGAPLWKPSALAVTPTLRPPTLEQDRVRVPLRGTVADVAVGGGGRFLVLRMAGKRQLTVFDVNEAKVVGEVVLAEARARFAAGIDKLLIAYPGVCRLDRYDLATLTLEAEERGLPDAIAGLYMGSASHGPALLCTLESRQEGVREAACTFYDPATLRPVRVRLEKPLPPINPDSPRASADGGLFAMVDPGGTLLTLALGGDGGRLSRLAGGSGVLVPGPDGRTVYGETGVYTSQLEKGRAGGGPFLPAHQGGFFLQARAKDGGTGDLLLYRAGEEKPALTIGGVEGVLDADPLGRDKRLHLLPGAKLLLSIPASNDCLVLRRFDVEAELKATGKD